MQPDLPFRETAEVRHPPGSDQRTLVRGKSANGRSQTLQQRATLRRYVAERQAAYERTRSFANWFRLRDARTAALREGV